MQNFQVFLYGILMLLMFIGNTNTKDITEVILLLSFWLFLTLYAALLEGDNIVYKKEEKKWIFVMFLLLSLTARMCRDIILEENWANCLDMFAAIFMIGLTFIFISDPNCNVEITFVLVGILAFIGLSLTYFFDFGNSREKTITEENDNTEKYGHGFDINYLFSFAD